MILVITKWDELQHYKDRDPTWVKLYRDLLSSEAWVLGTDASRLVQVASMLLAARYRNATPANYELFRKVANLDLSRKEYETAIAILVKHNFLSIQETNNEVYQDASNTLAVCTSEKSREEKSRGEKSQSARKCPSDFVVTDAMREWAGREFPAIDLERETAAFRDYTFAASRSDWPATWRNWIRKARPANGRNRTKFEQYLTKFEQSMKALDAWGSNDAGADEAPLAITGPNVRSQVR